MGIELRYTCLNCKPSQSTRLPPGASGTSRTSGNLASDRPDWVVLDRTTAAFGPHVQHRGVNGHLVAAATMNHCLDVGLLGHLERVVDLDAKVADGALEFGVPEEQLYRPQVPGTPVDQRRLCPAHRVRPVCGRIQPD